MQLQTLLPQTSQSVALLKMRVGARQDRYEAPSTARTQEDALEPQKKAARDLIYHLPELTV